MELGSVFTTYLAVMAGGAFGVAARMALTNVVPAQSPFPWGTFLVNILGCLFIGIVSGMSGISPLLRQVMIVGVLGGFTTFSAFSLQTVVLLGNGHFAVAAANVLFSVSVCLLATWGGLQIARLF